MYEIILKKQAEKFLKKLDTHNQELIIKKLKQLKLNPKLGKPLQANLTGLWRLRIDKYRAIYQIRNQELVISVLGIGHRKNIYED